MADIGFHLEALAKRFVPTFTKLLVFRFSALSQ